MFQDLMFHVNELQALETNTKFHCMVVACAHPKSWLFLRIGSEITESGHHMGTFFSRAAKMVILVISLNRHFVFCLSCVQTSMISCLLTLFCIVVKSALVQRSTDLSKSVLFS